MSTDQALLPVAVYGTLRQGQSNHHLLHGKTPLEQGWLEGFQLFDFGSNPAAVRGKSRLYVEIYSVSADELRRLDALEDYNPNRPARSLYLRETISSPSGAPCWIYLYNRPLHHRPIIASGRWQGPTTLR